MSDIEKRARELLAVEWAADGWDEIGRQVTDEHQLSESPSLRAIIAALTLPEGYVLVPVETLFDLVDDAEAHVRATEFRPARLVHKLRSVAEAKILLAARPEVK